MIALSLFWACASPPPPAIDPASFSPPSVDTASAAGGQQAARRGARPVLRSVRILPRELRAGVEARVEVQAEDADTPLLDLDRQWYVNGRKLIGRTGRHLDPSWFRKGDEVEVEVTASDGEHEVTRRSEPVRVQNTPPEIALPKGRITHPDGYRVRATDADGDTLHFLLEDAPPGLSIDPLEGVLSFEPPEVDEPADYDTRIIAEDPDGARATWELAFHLEPGRKPERRYVPAGG